MNLIEKCSAAAAARSINQYCPPRCFELAEKQFRFVIDTGEETGEYVLDFTDEEHLTWRKGGDEPKAEIYECRKADDWTYLLTYCLDGVRPKINHTWVIDREQGLVTFLRCVTGENAFYPYIIDSHFGFGYIAVEGEEHTDIRRHGFTGDVAGTCVKWTYGHNLSTVHVYHDPHWYRIAYPKNAVDTEDLPDASKKFRRLMKKMPGSDEPAQYVKIKDDMYLVSVTEQNLEKILGDEFGFRSDTLCFLDNWKRMYSVGRAFGTMTVDGEDRDLFVMIGKYGSPGEADESFFTDPVPYRV
ncbi:MAG: hypothetical protein IIZ51_05765 [Lachnospiraceae bacterium]|nr:hypothetical protein [Lachnospiraceae bacterium]